MINNFKISINKELVFKNEKDTLRLFSIYGEIFVFSKGKNNLEFIILELLKKSQQNVAEVFELLVKKIKITEDNYLSCIRNLKEKGVINFEFESKDGFSKNELERYKWQLEFLKNFQTEKISNYDLQKNWKNSKVTIIGLGGQGAIISQLLCAIGVGTITLVDGDKIESSNLTRQLIYSEQDIGKSKVDVLSSKLKSQNSNIQIKSINRYVESKKEMNAFFPDQDIVVLCADKPLISIREWANEASIKNNTPYIAVSGSWVGPICIPRKTACFECEKMHYRKKYPKYDEFLKMLKQVKQVPRASFSFRPVLSGTLIALQISKFLSKSMGVEVYNKKYKLDTSMNMTVEIIKRNKKCKLCGN